MPDPLRPPASSAVKKSASLQHDGNGAGETSFAETAMKLGGKSAEEARRMGAVDKADDQVESMFAARFQTVNSPIHRAIWERSLPVELFASPLPQTPSDVDRVMQKSLDAVRRHREAGTLLDQNKKITDRVLNDLAAAGYWGLLVDKDHGGSGAPFSSFAPFLTRMAMIDPTVAGLASVHGCIGAVDPVRTFGTPEQKQRFLPKLASGEHLSAFALTEPGAGSDLTALRTRADRAGNEFVVNGEKLFITNVVPGRTIGLVCLIEDRPAVLIVDLPNARERKLPASQIRPVRAQAHVQPGHHLPRFPRAGRESAHPAARRRFDDRLSRPEPRPCGALCQCRRGDAADDGQHDSLGPASAALTAKKSLTANWCSAGWVAWPRSLSVAMHWCNGAPDCWIKAIVARWSASSPKFSAAKH